MTDTSTFLNTWLQNCKCDLVKVRRWEKDITDSMECIQGLIDSKGFTSGYSEITQPGTAGGSEDASKNTANIPNEKEYNKKYEEAGYNSKFHRNTLKDLVIDACKDIKTKFNTRKIRGYMLDKHGIEAKLVSVSSCLCGLEESHVITRMAKSTRRKRYFNYNEAQQTITEVKQWALSKDKYDKSIADHKLKLDDHARFKARYNKARYNQVRSRVMIACENIQTKITSKKVKAYLNANGDEVSDSIDLAVIAQCLCRLANDKSITRHNKGKPGGMYFDLAMLETDARQEELEKKGMLAWVLNDDGELVKKED